jgi:transposase
MRFERESVVVVCPPDLPPLTESKEGSAVPRRIGLDVHREFAQIAVWEDGVVRQAGQIATTPEALRAFADSLEPSDEVALEATGNTHAIAKLVASRVARVVISNPMKTRAIAEAKVKTDKVDAKVLCLCWRRTFCRLSG